MTNWVLNIIFDDVTHGELARVISSLGTAHFRGKGHLMTKTIVSSSNAARKGQQKVSQRLAAIAAVSPEKMRAQGLALKMAKERHKPKKTCAWK